MRRPCKPIFQSSQVLISTKLSSKVTLTFKDEFNSRLEIGWKRGSCKAAVNENRLMPDSIDKGRNVPIQPLNLSSWFQVMKSGAGDRKWEASSFNWS